MHFLENRLLGSVLGAELRAAAFLLYWRRFKTPPDLAAISEETGISVEALEKAWEIVGAE